MKTTSKRKYQRVSPETEARILPFLRRFRGEKTATEIARLLGDVEPYAVKSVAARHGLKLRGKPGHIARLSTLLDSTDLSNVEAARAIGCTRQMVGYARRKKNAGKGNNLIDMGEWVK